MNSVRIPRRFAIVTLSCTFLCFAQKDPGVRGGPPGAGGPIPGLTDNELALFNEGKLRMTQLEAVCDTCSDVPLGANTGQDPNLATLTNSSGSGRDDSTATNARSATSSRPSADRAASWCRIRKIRRTSTASPKIRCST